ncbi:hypothetical protein TKK_0009570 [Trichogramma kaykai]|uniref:Alpha-2-macroglobulin receptor-associated protein n=1 Tax=Trichogramma kaykai TaxID=54128 RepID=A0ABD2X0N5_9HYME
MALLIKASLYSAIVILLVQYSDAVNKYSKEANTLNSQKAKTAFSASEQLEKLRHLDKPFRMHKLNMVWTKAKHRLPNPKLQSLYSDLHIQDKEEIAFKHYRADGKDEGGLGEARLRKKLLGIMERYDLLEHFEEISKSQKNKKKFKPYEDSKNIPVPEVFKNPKLNELWAKAERGGFTTDELEALKEEFGHHQDKIDEYMSLIENFESKTPDAKHKHKNSLDESHEKWNEIEFAEEDESNDIPKHDKEYHDNAKLIKQKHLEVRSGFDHLERIAAKAPKHNEFVDPKVQELWHMAKESKFSEQELESLREELFHYETRLLKLRHMHTEAALEAARKGKDYYPDASSYNQIKIHTRDIEKMHQDIEEKIYSKHGEL